MYPLVRKGRKTMDTLKKEEIQGFLTCPYGTGKFSNKNVVFVSFPLENLWKT